MTLNLFTMIQVKRINACQVVTYNHSLRPRKRTSTVNSEMFLGHKASLEANALWIYDADHDGLWINDGWGFSFCFVWFPCFAQISWLQFFKFAVQVAVVETCLNWRRFMASLLMCWKHFHYCSSTNTQVYEIQKFLVTFHIPNSI